MSTPPPFYDTTAAERSFRRRFYPGCTQVNWQDWRWQMRHRARTPEAIENILNLSVRERRALHAPETWRMPVAITPYALSLLARQAPDSAFRRTLLPDCREVRMSPGEHADPLGEARHAVAPGLIRAYPHKALLLATTDCASFCRYCTRARTAPWPGKRPCESSLAQALDWLRHNPDIHDVLISGGDPLAMVDSRLEHLLQALGQIPHIRLVRIGTKIPAVLPQRITPALVRLLKRQPLLWMSVHFTHPAELTAAAAAACARLRAAGIPLMNQTVLLRGINDDVPTMHLLNEGLVQMGVKPYYLHQGDMAAGTAHLRSTVAKGRAILGELCGRVPGYAIPHFMLDPPGGGGKTHLGIRVNPRLLRPCEPRDER